MRVAEWVRSFEGRAPRVCSLQIANADCSLGPRAQLQGSAVRLQIAGCKCSVQRAGLSCFCKGNPKKRPLTPQNTQGPGPSADPRLQMQIAARGGEGSCRAGARLQISDCKCRLQHAAEREAAGLGPVCRSQIANADCSTRGRGELQGNKPHSTEFDSKMISVTATKG